MSRWSRIKIWLPAIGWAVVISGLSTDTFSGAHTSVIIIPLLHWLFPRASPDTLETLHFIVRKMAHFTEYFIFSILLMRALCGKDRGWSLRWAIYAVCIAAGYAALDEFHQTFVPSRHGSPWDALLDTTGASAAQFVLYIWYTLRGRSLDGTNKPTSLD